MKTLTIHRIGFALLLFLGIGCANSDEYSIPEITYYELQPTITMEQLYNMATDSIQKITTDEVIEAYVVSSDVGGNFFKSISLQNREGTKGFSLAVDMYNIYTEVEVGRKVYISLKDLYFGISHGALSIGESVEEGKIVRIRPQLFRDKVLLSSEKLSEEQLIRKMTISELKSNNNLNILVELDQVQFDKKEVLQPYYDPAKAYTGATNRKIEDLTSSVVFRTSQYAQFAQQIIPFKSGTIRGILTKYGSTFQFMSRSIDDIKLDQPYRYASTYKGGTEIVFQDQFSHDFESYAVSTDEIPQFINDQTEGGRYWEIKSFAQNKFIQMSSFGGGGVTANAYLFIPAYFTGNNAFSFETKDGYYRGEVLKVYYVLEEHYAIGQYITKEHFIDITAHFMISQGNENGYGSQFIPSGNYIIPQIGNGYIVFEYFGTPTRSTTMQIDNLRLE